MRKGEEFIYAFKHRDVSHFPNLHNPLGMHYNDKKYSYIRGRFGEQRLFILGN
jgi:hypothetical protein